MGQKYDIIKSVVRNDETVTVKLFGSLTVDTADSFTEALKGKLDDAEVLVLDMQMLAYVTSAGIRSLIKAIKEMSAQGGKVVARNVNQDVMGVFKLMNIHTLMTIEG